MIESLRRIVFALMVLVSTVSAFAQLKNSAYARGQLTVVPAETVVVNRFGIYPETIVRPEGPFVLYIVNQLRGHLEHFSLTLEQDEATELIGIDTEEQHFRSSALLDLKPGKYRLRFRKSSQLSLTLEIQGK